MQLPSSIAIFSVELHTFPDGWDSNVNGVS